MGFEIAGKTALVTGANRGIGRAIVQTLAAHGAAKIYAGARTLSSLDTLVASDPERIRPILIDLNRPETITAAAKQASDVQLVINNAGMLRTAGPLAPNAIDDLQAEIEVNVYGLMRMAQAFAPVLKANGGGAFVQVNSVVSLKNFADFATYGASKAAAYSMTQALREKLGAQGTQVLSVHPGPIATDMAVAAGMRDMAESPSLVSEGIVTALRAGVFHLFPDSMARQIGAAYESFAASVIEAPGGE